ncbi:hypothetical protein AB0M39_19505 [Streptomyces sp. NPDC051907]|uniref:hypothetical protein n=1 Tax=Streptomyces sp. NPDC051907 TaxID=3155284 RepID=UPI00341B2AD8
MAVPTETFPHRSRQLVPPLLVATIRHTVATSLLSLGRQYVDRHYAERSSAPGTAGAR